MDGSHFHIRRVTQEYLWMISDIWKKNQSTLEWKKRYRHYHIMKTMYLGLENEAVSEKNMGSFTLFVSLLKGWLKGGHHQITGWLIDTLKVTLNPFKPISHFEEPPKWVSFILIAPVIVVVFREDWSLLLIKTGWSWIIDGKIAKTRICNF